MLTNAEVNSVEPATRQSYITAHDAFVALVETQQLLLGADHATLGPSACTSAGRGVDRKKRERSRGWPCLERSAVQESLRHHHIMIRCRRALRRFVRDERGPRTHCRWKRWCDLLKQRHLLDKLAGFALVMSYDLFTRPSDILHISSRDVIALQARGSKQCHSSFAEGGCNRRDSSTNREKRPIRRHNLGQLAALPARIRAGAPDSSESRLPDRPAVALATQKEEESESNKKGGDGDSSLFCRQCKTRIRGS